MKNISKIQSLTLEAKNGSGRNFYYKMFKALSSSYSINKVIVYRIKKLNLKNLKSLSIFFVRRNLKNI